MSNQSSGPKCPKCGGPMTRREKKDGTGAFYGCNAWKATGCKGYADAPAEAGETRALVVRELPKELQRSEPIRALAEFAEQCARLKAVAHVVTPLQSLDQIPPFMAVSQRVITVDAQNKMEAYKTGNGQMALGKVVLDRIATCNGVKWTRSERVGDTSHPYRVDWIAEGVYRGLDGDLIGISGSRTVDLRENGADFAGMVDDARRRLAKARGVKDTKNLAAVREAVADDEAEDEAWEQISQARKFITSIAESKAKNRAIRSMGLQASYTPDELAKPFVCFKLVQSFDINDPAQREVALAQAAGATEALFGGRREPRNVTPVAPPVVVDHGDDAPPPASDDDVPFDGPDEPPPAADDVPFDGPEEPPPPPEKKQIAWSSRVALLGQEIGLTEEEQRGCVSAITGKATRTSVTDAELYEKVAGAMREAAEDKRREQAREAAVKRVAALDGDGSALTVDGYNELTRLGRERGIEQATWTAQLFAHFKVQRPRALPKFSTCLATLGW